MRLDAGPGCRRVCSVRLKGRGPSCNRRDRALRHRRASAMWSWRSAGGSGWKWSWRGRSVAAGRSCRSSNTPAGISAWCSRPRSRCSGPETMGPGPASGSGGRGGSSSMQVPADGSSRHSAPRSSTWRTPTGCRISRCAAPPAGRQRRGYKPDGDIPRPRGRQCSRGQGNAG